MVCLRPFVQIPLPAGSIVDASHSGAMFGSLNSATPVVGTGGHGSTSAAASAPDDDALMHPSVSAASLN